MTPLCQVKPEYDIPTVLLSNTNTRPLTNKTDELEGVHHSNNVAVAAITKTWMCASIPESCTHKGGFSACHMPRSGCRGGGLALSVRSSFPVRALDMDVPSDLEYLWLLARPHRLPRGVSSVIIAAVYKPPETPTEEKLLDHIADSVTTLRAKYRNCGLLTGGDFNRAKTTHICDQQLVNIVKPPTWSNNTLDLILSNLSEWYQNSEILPSVSISDHSTVLWRPNSLSSISLPPPTTMYR